MQQGQVDWVAFGNTIWTASAAVLQRFAASNIQPVTFGAGLALANQFQMSRDGRERMDHTIQSLRGAPGFDKLLWFGFGQQSFVRMMGETQLGLNCVALCSCLAETHSEIHAARVLKDLWELKDFPGEYEPAHSQFLALVKACSGAVSRSGFGQELDAMTRGGDCGITGHGDLAADTTDLAKALDGLFQMTRNKVETITFVGEKECAFLAAIGRWLFDFTVYIENIEGRLLYRSHESVTQGNTQILVRYSSEVRPGSVRQSATYILLSGRSLITDDSQDACRWILKVPWESCLQQAYGETFQSLSALVHIFGSYLGCCARIYEALARGEPNVGVFSRVGFTEFSERGYGHGFIHSTNTIFVELDTAGLNEAMKSSLNKTFEDAVKEVEQDFQRLKNSCSCCICSGYYHIGNPSLPPEDPEKLRDNCLVVLAMTIRHLISILACTDRDIALPVAVSGLKSFYTLYESVYRLWLDKSVPEVMVAALATGLKTKPTKEENMSKDKSTFACELPKNPIDEIRPLFDGSIWHRRNQSDRWGTTATAADGVCCYRQSLRSCSSEAQVMRTIYVLPGHIEKFHTPYDLVTDGSVENRGTPSDDPATLGGLDSDEQNLQPIELGKFSIKALAFEPSGYRHLCFYYKVTEPGGATEVISPGLFTEFILRFTGLLTCSRGRQCRKQLCTPATVVQKGWAVDERHDGLIYTSGLALCLWFYKGDLARCYALSRCIDTCLPLQISAVSNIFLKRDECLPCSSHSINQDASTIIGQTRPRRAVAHLI